MIAQPLLLSPREVPPSGVVPPTAGKVSTPPRVESAPLDREVTAERGVPVPAVPVVVFPLVEQDVVALVFVEAAVLAVVVVRVDPAVAQGGREERPAGRAGVVVRVAPGIVVVVVTVVPVLVDRAAVALAVLAVLSVDLVVDVSASVPHEVALVLLGEEGQLRLEAEEPLLGLLLGHVLVAAATGWVGGHAVGGRDREEADEEDEGDGLHDECDAGKRRCTTE